MTTTTTTSVLPLKAPIGAHNFAENVTDLPQDCIKEVFKHGLNTDLRSCQALACTNSHFYRSFGEMVQDADLETLCPLLNIISAAQAEECGFLAEPLSVFPKLEVIKAYFTMNCHVEADAGVTFFNFRLSPQITLNEIVQLMENKGIEASIYGEPGDPADIIISKIGDIPVGEIFPGMGANSIFENTRWENFDDQLAIVNAHGCQMPTVEQSILHIFFVQQVFNRCLFGENTFGRALTLIEGRPVLVVGGFNSTRIRAFPFNPNYVATSYGAGGWLKF